MDIQCIGWLLQIVNLLAAKKLKYINLQIACSKSI